MRPLGDAAVAHLRGVLGLLGLDEGRYRLRERLGAGGMGTVWLADDLELERPVALKVMHAADPTGELEARILREARTIARLDHPGILPVHDLGRLPDGRTFYTMRWVRGETLAASLARPAALSERLRVLLRVAEAVAFAHEHGVVHRDLKPENVMIGAFGEVQVLDWGIAKLTGEATLTGGPAPAAAGSASGAPGATAHGAVLGTPPFMAPEQARGESASVDARADVFALGMILGRMLEAPGPADGGTRRRPGPALLAIVEKATAPEPAGRYARAADFAADVAAFLDGGEVSARRAGTLERLLRWSRRHRFVIALVAGYLALRLAVALLTRR